MPVLEEEPTVVAPPKPKGLRAVAILEGAKGLAVLIVGVGALTLLGRDAEAVAEEVVQTFHLNPASRYPMIFVEYAKHITDRGLYIFSVIAVAYSSIRFAEAYGLWRGRRWAEWFGALSGAIYIPIEIYELVLRPTDVKVGVLLVNVAIVGYLAYVLWRSREVHAAVVKAKAAVRRKVDASERVG